MPPYRPVNTDRDQSQIRVYTSGIERVFIATMFTGVFTIAVSSSSCEEKALANEAQTAAKAWHGTFGRINDRIFRYQIGGEY